MAKLKQCDRCKSIFNYTATTNVMTVSTGVTADPNKIKRDLCGDCRSDLDTFMINEFRVPPRARKDNYK